MVVRTSTHGMVHPQRCGAPLRIPLNSFLSIKRRVVCVKRPLYTLDIYWETIHSCQTVNCDVVMFIYDLYI